MNEDFRSSEQAGWDAAGNSKNQESPTNIALCSCKTSGGLFKAPCTRLGNMRVGCSEVLVLDDRVLTFSASARRRNAKEGDGGILSYQLASIAHVKGT